jgi:hypothetical protein
MPKWFEMTAAVRYRDGTAGLPLPAEVFADFGHRNARASERDKEWRGDDATRGNRETDLGQLLLL